MDLLAPEDALIVPSGPLNAQPASFDMRKIHRAESRMTEIAIVNKHKAQELLSCFNEAARDLWKHQHQVEKFLIDARKAQAKAHSIVVLDRAPTLLRERGLVTAKNPAGSEDLRTAVLEADPDYVAATENLEQIQAIEELLKNKLKSMEWCFTSVKKILGESGYGSTPKTNHNPNSGWEPAEPPSLGPPSKPKPPSGFGRPSY